MEGYKSKIAGAGQGSMKENKGGDREVLGHNNKHMFGVNTMSEKYDMGRVNVLPTGTRGQPQLAWDYDY